MKKIFSLMVSIACLVILSSSILSLTIKAQAIPEAQDQEMPEVQAIPGLVSLLTNAGFKVTLSSYPDTSITKSMVATASRPVSLNAFPSLAPYGSAFEHHVLIPTFTVESAQRSFFKEKLQQFQQKYKLNLVQTADGGFIPTNGYKTNAGWRPQDLDLFKTYFDNFPSTSASLSNSIYVKTIEATLHLTKVDRAREFYTDLQKSHPQDAQRLKELVQLRLLLQQRGYKIAMIPASTEMQAHPNSRVNLKDVPDLSFYKDKLVFTFMFDPIHVPHVGSKLKALHRKYPSISPMLNGFKMTEGWTNTDLNNFKKEFDSLSSYIYLTEVSVSLITFANVLNSAQSYGLGGGSGSQLSYVVEMEELIGAVTKAI